MHTATTNSTARAPRAAHRISARTPWWVRIDHSRLTSIALVLALALIAAQLSAIFNVVQGQVQRAQLRDALLASKAKGVVECPAASMAGATVEGAQGLSAAACVGGGAGATTLAQVEGLPR